MAKRYQDVLDAIRKDVASQIGGLLWDGIEIDPCQPGRLGRSVRERAIVRP